MYLAYLDAGTGSMLASAVVAGFAGAMVVVKVWWRRVLGKFRRHGDPQPTAAGTPADAEAPAPAEREG